MFRNYLKTAIRNLFKNRVLSVINIAGLVFGMAAAMLLILNIQYSFSIDDFHEKKNQLFVAYSKDELNGGTVCYSETAAPLAPLLQKDYPEIRAVTRVAAVSKLLSVGDKKIQEGGSYADEAFFSLFSYPMLEGNTEHALTTPNSIVLTASTAKKLFGNEPAMNKIIQADNKDNFTVTGILEDLPANTDMKFGYLLPWSFVQANGGGNLSWDNHYLTTYAEVVKGADITALNKKLSDQFHKEQPGKAEAFLYPFTKKYLYGRFENGKPAGGRIENMRFLGILAFVLLLIACINFMNLSTARSARRAREVGVRKVMGANKRSLVLQFIGESILLALIAGGISLGIVELILPTFSAFANIHPEISYGSPWFWLSAAGFVLFTGLLAGSYPAFYLSSFKPVRVLKGVFKNANALVTPRKVLVVLQFTISILLINFTILFRKQVNHTQGREVGFVKDNLVFHPLSSDLRKNYVHIKNELLNSGTASSVSTSNTAITRGGTTLSGLSWKGMQPGTNTGFELISTSGDFVTTNGLKLLQGRDINLEQYPADTNSCLINESTASVLGFKEPVGQVITDEGKNWTIVGLVKNFVIGAPNQAVQPALILGTNWDNYISIRLNSNNAMQHASVAENILKKYNPGYITELQFADADYARRFRESRNASVLISSFALIAIFISCMGLFGLATYMTELRTREIGIRKVFGSSVAAISALLAKDFVKLVTISILIATPIAWLLMSTFLRSFQYRTTVSWWILAGAGLGSILIAILTVGFQSVKAAKANPVKSLRAE